MKIKTLLIVANFSSMLFGTSWRSEEDGGYTRDENYPNIWVYHPNGGTRTTVSVYIAFFVFTLVVIH